MSPKLRDEIESQSFIIGMTVIILSFVSLLVGKLTGDNLVTILVVGIPSIMTYKLTKRVIEPSKIKAKNGTSSIQ